MTAKNARNFYEYRQKFGRFYLASGIWSCSSGGATDPPQHPNSREGSDFLRSFFDPAIFRRTTLGNFLSSVLPDFYVRRANQGDATETHCKLMGGADHPPAGAADVGRAVRPGNAAGPALPSQAKPSQAADIMPNCSADI